MTKVTKIEKNNFGFKVIDTRNGDVVKEGIKKGSRAAAIASVYEEQIKEAQRTWGELTR